MQDGLCKIHVSFTTSNDKILYLTCMLSCPPNLTYSFLTICEIITFKVHGKVFPNVLEGYSRVLQSKKKPFLGYLWLCLFVFLFIGELGTCPKNCIYTRGVEHWEKNEFPQGGMLKFIYKGQILTMKKAYKKVWYSKSKCEHMHWWFTNTYDFCFAKSSNSQFLVLIQIFRS
jgi:hypothetical protein